MERRGDYLQMAAMLEQQELQSGGDVSSQIYAQLLAIYLLLGDLLDAKMLYKRIPVDLKNENEDIIFLWKIGKCLFKRTLSNVYDLIDAKEWPSYLATIMRDMREETRKAANSLVSMSYSHIQLNELNQFLNIKNEIELNTYLCKNGWKMDETAAIPTVCIESKPISCQSPDGNHENLKKLTDYVSFLEN